MLFRGPCLLVSRIWTEIRRSLHSIRRFVHRARKTLTMKRKHAAKPSAWTERDGKRTTRTGSREPHVRIVKVVFPVAEDVKAMDESQLRGEGDSFPNAVWPVLALAQCFGLMPVVGIHSPNQAKIAFRWRTLRTMVTGVYLLVGIVVTLLYLKRIVYLGINANNMVGLVFFSCCCFCGLLFLMLAQRWKALITTWCQHEAVFLRPPYQSTGWTLSTRLRLTAAFFLSLALLEHIMYFVSTIYNIHMRITKCNWDAEDVWKTFFLSEHRHIFKVFPYHIIITIMVLTINFSFTFAWNYMDIFVMLVSIAMSTRFRQLNVRIAGFGSEVVNDNLWQEIRLHFVKLCELLEIVDKNLAPLILLSCANNLYFICFQLLNIFNSLPYLINYLYFWYSLLYLIGRTICVFLCAAAIHDASRKPLEFIRHTQTSRWCPELERFNDQVSTETIALSGMKFFYITRKLLFGMAGTIVTYELVLLQIDAGTKKTGNVRYCDQNN